LQTINSLHHVTLGYRTDHILVAHLSIPSYRFTGRNVTADLYEPLLERVQHLHGVESAGLISEVPLGDTWTIGVGLWTNGQNRHRKVQGGQSRGAARFRFPHGGWALLQRHRRADVAAGGGGQ
jgi:hypothetical protein